jgi:glutamate carboxypeptidase
MKILRDKVISLVDRYEQEQVDFLTNLCHQNSYSHNKEGVDRASAMVVESLAGIMPVHKIQQEREFGHHHILKNSVATTAKAIYLVGHVDTVFPPDHSFQKCNRKADILTGPGTADMKGGLVVMVFTLKILNELGILNNMPLAIILNSDEEAGSISSLPLFLAEREKARLCLVAECAGLHNEIVVSRNGKMGARVRSFGKGRHVSHGAAHKSSAILEIAHKIIVLEGLNGEIPGVDINIGSVNGGLGSNTVPESASCLLDIRWKEGERQQQLQSRLEAEVAQHHIPGCHSQLEVLNFRPAMPQNPTNRPLVQMVQQIARSLGQEIDTEHRRGTSDANFFGSFAIPTLDGWGPVGDKDHTSEEFIKISSLRERTALMSLFLLEYAGQSGMIP